jgi:hypothetical protein
MFMWLFWVLSLITLNAYAQPVVCPSVSAIQSVGLSNRLAQDNDGKWYAGRVSQYYGTSDQWTFVIGGISAPNKQKAIEFANLALSSLHLITPNPVKITGGKYACKYSNDFDYLSGAITPPINSLTDYKGRI